MGSCSIGVIVLGGSCPLEYVVVPRVVVARVVTLGVVVPATTNDL